MKQAIAISRRTRHRPALAADARCTAGHVERSCRLSVAAGGMPDQFLRPDGQNGPAPGSRRRGFRRAGGVAFARQFLPVSRRRIKAQRSDPLVPARVPATRWFSAAMPGWRFMASTASIPAHRPCSPEGGRINLTLRRVTRPDAESARPRRPQRRLCMTSR